MNVRFSDTPISALAPPHVGKSSKIKRFQAFMRWGPARGDKKVLKIPTVAPASLGEPKPGRSVSRASSLAAAFRHRPWSAEEMAPR